MAGLSSYRELCASKRPTPLQAGLAVIPDLNPTLFPHQAHGVDFALRAGRAGLFYDTGLGKTAMMLEWGRVVVEETNKPVLMLAPLAVGAQHVREAERLGIDARQARYSPADLDARIFITNYERLDKFSADDFAGVILDESSILKSFTGKTTRKLIEAFAQTPFRLAGTATPAPNDHTELGQHSDFLGVMDRDEMLVRWFLHDSMNTKDWRLKRHAVRPFWDWVASWARCVSKPSDLGFSDDGFALPELRIERHIVTADRSIDSGEEKNGQARLFRIPDRSATAIHKEKRLTVASRAKLAAEIVFGDWGCLGSLNTPNAGVPNIGQTPKSVIGESSKAALPKSTSPTCENTTSKTLTSSVATKRRKRSATNAVAQDTQLIPSSATGANNKPAMDALQESATAGSRQHSESQLPTTTGLPQGKMGGVQSAALTVATNPDESSRLIIATTRDGSAGCYAEAATSGSASSETIPISSDAPQNTSKERDWWVVWCDTDYEQDELEWLFGNAAISIRGSHPMDRKEESHERWLAGERKVLICKPVMFGHGLNWQHCCKMVFVGLSFSYEAYYQAVRRCWRFGQKRPVTAHVISADTEMNILSAVHRKAGDHERMKSEMAAAMRRAAHAHEILDPYHPDQEARLPAWLS